MEKRGFCQLLLITAILVGSATLFFAIGALGPPSSHVTYHNFRMCVLPNAGGHIWNPTYELINDESCDKIGRRLETEAKAIMKKYPLQNVLFYVQIPYIKDHVMSRLFQHLITDLGIQFSSNDYLKRLMDHGLNMLRFEVALGYRDAVKGPWHRMAQANVTRTLRCQLNNWGYLSCDHLPFFELGSCHHKQYVVNLLFPSLPLGKALEEFSGLAPLTKITTYVVHQSMGFTRLWLALKSIFCPVNILALVWFLRRAAAAVNTGLIEKSLAFLGTCLVLYNVPLELLSLFFDCPWLLVANDFRQGLFIAALFSFWVIFVGEHRPQEDGAVKSHIGHYWRQIGVVAVTCVFLFVYEFCERGIQAVYPFYSLWSNWLSTAVAWVFIGTAALSAALYMVVLVAMVIGVYWNIRKRRANLSQMSASARDKFEAMFSHLKFFLGLTMVVAMVTVGTVVLPSELLLHHWQQGRAHYSFYSALLTGNYGLWNTYTVLMMVLHAPATAANHPPEHDATHKLLTKQSNE